MAAAINFLVQTKNQTSLYDFIERIDYKIKISRLKNCATSTYKPCVQ